MLTQVAEGFSSFSPFSHFGKGKNQNSKRSFRLLQWWASMNKNLKEPCNFYRVYINIAFYKL